MVKRLAILGCVLAVLAMAGMAWAETNMGVIPAPEPMVMPAAAPPVCIGGACRPVAPPPPPMMMPMRPKRLSTSIDVKLEYPQLPPPGPPPACGPCGPAAPPIPVAVPMWKFIVPWPPFVYYLPVE